MRITKNFAKHEFDCRGSKLPYPKEWVESRLEPLCLQLQIIRDEVSKVVKKESPITILSGYRTPAHNQLVGGAINSLHLHGRAADFMCKNISAKRLGNIVERLIKEKRIPDGGLHIYHWGVHYDIRGRRARW